MLWVLIRNIRGICSAWIYRIVTSLEKRSLQNFMNIIFLTLLLLNTTCPVLANSVDPDQLASEEAN